MNLITKAELARRAGVTPAAVTKACSGALAAAVVREGTLIGIDADHPVAAAYVANSTPQREQAKRRDSRNEDSNDEFDERVLASLHRLTVRARTGRLPK